MRATVREGGRSYPVRRYPSCLSAARPARDRAFYVPRLVLGVGTPRARNSECHSRHSFTHNACSTHRFPRYCTATWMSSVDAKKRVPKGTLSNWRLPPLPQYTAVQYHRRCCVSLSLSLSALSRLPSPLSALSRALSRAPQARTPPPAPRL